MDDMIAKALYEHWVEENCDIEFAPWAKLGDKETWLSRARAVLAAMPGWQGIDEAAALIREAAYHIRSVCGTDDRPDSDSGHLVARLDDWLMNDQAKPAPPDAALSAPREGDG